MTTTTESSLPVAARGRFLRRLLQSPRSLTALLVLFLLVVIAVLAPWLAPFEPNQQELSNRLMSPSAEHWLGTDAFGMDVLSRLLVATRTDLFAAVEAVMIAFLVGVPLGLVSGYFGGATDMLLGRAMDAVMALPALVLAVVVVGVFGPGLRQAMLAIAIVMVPTFYRVARGSTQDVSNELYIESAKSSGCSTVWILRKHVVPGILPPLVIQCSFAMSAIIVAGASLSFLGLGARPPQATWGGMLNDAAGYIGSHTFLLYPPMFMMVVTILALSMLGDGLRDALGRDLEGRR